MKRPKRIGLGPFTVFGAYTPRGWAQCWRETIDGPIYTNCLMCGTILKLEHGPHCGNCRPLVEARKRMTRRIRKGLRRPSSPYSESNPGTGVVDGPLGLSNTTATLQGPRSTSSSRSAGAAFGGQVTPRKRIAQP